MNAPTIIPDEIIACHTENDFAGCEVDFFEPELDMATGESGVAECPQITHIPYEFFEALDELRRGDLSDLTDDDFRDVTDEDAKRGDE